MRAFSLVTLMCGRPTADFVLQHKVGCYQVMQSKFDANRTTRLQVIQMHPKRDRLSNRDAE